nr:S3 peptide [Glycine max=soybeans, Merrill, cv Miyagishirome, seeds, Peptide Partial, 10 aa] [Glycine max]
ADPTFGTPLG